MNTDRWVVVNHSNVCSEIIDGEAVIIDLSAGNYFCVESTATVLWEELSAPCPLSHLTAVVQKHFPDAPANLEPLILEFLDRLLEEKLICEVPSGAIQPRETALVPGPFQAPVLEKYSDMQNLLLLDPVHEVDERGWPSAAP